MNLKSACSLLLELNEKNKVESDQGTRPNQKNKLRTYRLFKNCYITENYVDEVLNRQHRSALAKFGCGVAVLRKETGRYERLTLVQRVCFNCSCKVEDEFHVLTECPLYDDLRQILYQKAAVCLHVFYNPSECDKMCFILSNIAIAKATTKACHEVLNRRRNRLYKQ